MQNTIATNPKVYVIESELNMLEFNPAYPSQPKTVGEKLRKTRMDKALQIKELAKIIGVTPDAIINWELKGIRPRKGALEKLESFLEI